MYGAAKSAQNADSMHTRDKTNGKIIFDTLEVQEPGAS